MTKSLEAFIDYLVDHGIPEDELNHFLHQKLFMGSKISLMELIREQKWDEAYALTESYFVGDFV